MMDVLQKACHFFDVTNGLFDPSVLPDLICTGYDRSMDEIRAQDGIVSSVASERKPKADFREMELELTLSRVRLPKDMQLDFGGIAKGWIVDQAITLLSRYPMLALSMRATTCVHTVNSPIGLGLPVELEDPRDPSQSIARLTCYKWGSGNLIGCQADMEESRKNRHHLIDPRTGEPAQSYWLCATVMADDTVTAEVFAKALLIGGPAEVQKLTAHNNIVYLAVDREGALHSSPNSQEYVNEHEYIHQ